MTPRSDLETPPNRSISVLEVMLEKEKEDSRLARLERGRQWMKDQEAGRREERLLNEREKMSLEEKKAVSLKKLEDEVYEACLRGMKRSEDMKKKKKKKEEENEEDRVHEVEVEDEERAGKGGGEEDEGMGVEDEEDEGVVVEDEEEEEEEEGRREEQANGVAPVAKIESIGAKPSSPPPLSSFADHGEEEKKSVSPTISNAELTVLRASSPIVVAKTKASKKVNRKKDFEKEAEERAEKLLGKLEVITSNLHNISRKVETSPMAKKKQPSATKKKKKKKKIGPNSSLVSAVDDEQQNDWDKLLL